MNRQWLDILKFFLLFVLAVTTFYNVYLLSKTDSKVFAQCLLSDLNEGLISAVGGSTGNTGNPGQICVTGNNAQYRDFKVPTYQDLEDQFYALNRSAAKKTTAPPQSPVQTLNFPAGSGVYLQPNTLTINNVTGTGTGVQVIFVQGDLNITGNITYANADMNSGLVFIVRDNINIYSNVTQVNAVLISTGNGLPLPSTTGYICSSYVTGPGCVNTPSTQQLVINGSLISLNKTDLGSASAIQFIRSLAVNVQPAEVVNKQAKYLYLLRGGIFTKDLIITTEDQHYTIPGVTSTPYPSATPLPPPICTEVLLNPPPDRSWTISNLIISGCLWQRT